MAVLEAMAAAKPVVAVHTPAFDEFAEDGVSACFVARQDAGLLAGAIIELFGDADRAARLGAAARAAAERFRVEDTAEALVDVLAAAVDRHRAGPPTGVPRIARVVRRAAGTARRRPPFREPAEVVVRSGPAAGLRLGGGPASADYSSGTNELPVQEAIVAALAPGAVFFDVGANVGFFALLAARAVGPEGRVVAFEPVPELAGAIVDNAGRNDLDVTVLPVAVGGADGREPLHLARHPGGAALASAGPPPDRRGELDVEVRTLDALVAEGAVPAPDVVKIDVEGAEPAVLAGMTELLRTRRPVVVCELDGPTRAEVDRKVEEVRTILDACGYGVRRLRDAYAGAGWTVTHVVGEPAG